MDSLFESPSWILCSLAVVVPSVLISLAVLWFVRKCITPEELKKNHDVAGFTLSIIGVLYSVILGFTVINVQNRYTQTRETVHTEAVLLADLYQAAVFFSPNERDAIRSSLREYTNYVIQEEWWMATEKKIRLKTRSLMKKIWESYYQVELKNEKMSIWYTESISKLDSFMNARLSRQFNSWERLGGMMWSLLISGGIITTVFMFFFGLENLRSQMAMTALLVGYISFMLYLVYSLDHTFQGPEGLKPYDLEQVIALFDQWDLDSLAQPQK